MDTAPTPKPRGFRSNLLNVFCSVTHHTLHGGESASMCALAELCDDNNNTTMSSTNAVIIASKLRTAAAPRRLIIKTIVKSAMEE